MVFPITFLVLSVVSSPVSESENNTTLLTMTLVLAPAVAEPLNITSEPLMTADRLIRLLFPEKCSLYVVMYASVPSCVTSASMLEHSPVDWFLTFKKYLAPLFEACAKESSVAVALPMIGVRVISCT